MRWIKNTDGKRDAVLTLTLIGFIVIMIKLLLADTVITFNGDTYKFGELSAAIIAAVLTPTLGAYVSRRYTDRKFNPVEYDELDDEDEEL